MLMTFISGFGWSLIAAFADSRSDIVLVEASFPPAGGHAVKDGRSLLGALTSRLSRLYRKPSFWTAGNEPFMSSVVDASIARAKSMGIDLDFEVKLEGDEPWLQRFSLFREARLKAFSDDFASTLTLSEIVPK